MMQIGKFHCACVFYRGEEFGEAKLVEPCAYHKPLESDAARYRWLREERDEQQPVVTQATFSTWGNPWRDVPLWGNDLDLAVDSAMLSSPQAQPSEEK